MKRHLPNALTCLNLLTGAFGCIAIFEGQHENALYYVLLSAFFDFLDGFAARLLHVQTEIGKELDSLADMVSFGLLPSLYMVTALEHHLVLNNEQMPYIGLLIAAFSALRLAKFNVDTRQSDRFIGLPTPANAIMITSLSFIPAAISITGSFLMILTLISCYLMVAELPMIALKFKGFGWKGNQWRYALVMVVVVSAGVFQLAAVPFVIPVYLVLSVMENLASGSFFKPYT